MLQGFVVVVRLRDLTIIVSVAINLNMCGRLHLFVVSV